MELILAKYGDVIATDDKGIEIYNVIKAQLRLGNTVIIDAKDVTISTKSSRLIFGRLYKEFESKFQKLVSFKNLSPLFSFAVNEGIATEMEN